ncbi:MAG: carbohydrate-binding family 9-like protein [Candidatus Latescibacterota bacterium]|nr:carbohydrate-binding family 9-like protein [Candidatus Latescibacterota bacterium]
MLVVLSIALVASTWIGCATQQQRARPLSDSLPETVVARTQSPVIIDGRPDDAAWQAAEPITFIFPWNDVTVEEPQSTVARMLYDDNALYIVYECTDPYLDSEVTEKDGPVYEEDAVEIFATPNPADITTYYGYEMNINGALLDYIAFKGGKHWTQSIHFPWESEGVQIATSYDGTLNDHSDVDKGWVLEIAIPFDNFRHLGVPMPPRTGDVWRLNLNRTKGDLGQFSQWADTQAHQAAFHHSAYFGIAHFGAKRR